MICRHGIVDRLSVISAVGDHSSNRIFYLIKQVRHGGGDIADIVGYQFAGADLVGIGINSDVQFPPASARPDPVLLIQPFTLAIDFKARAVDQQVDWFAPRHRLRQNGQASTSAAEGCVVRNLYDRPKQAGNGA